MKLPIYSLILQNPIALQNRDCSRPRNLWGAIFLNGDVPNLVQDNTLKNSRLGSAGMFHCNRDYPMISMLVVEGINLWWSFVQQFVQQNLCNFCFTARNPVDRYAQKSGRQSKCALENTFHSATRRCLDFHSDLHR